MTLVLGSDEREGIAGMVQRVAEAIDANIPDKMAWVFSAEAIEADGVTGESSAIELFFANARAGLQP